MTFAPRLVIVVLAAYGVAALAGSAALMACWGRLMPFDADRLFRSRLAPAAAASLFSLATIVVFLRFEPRAGVERTPVLLIWLAATAAVVLGRSIARTAAGHWNTRRLRRTWLSSAEPAVLPDIPVPSLVVDSRFPIVAVIGILRPRVIVARSVLRACSPDEWRAIAAHETWHLRRRDTARRALLAAVPDPLAWLPFSRQAARLWSDAAEAAADRAAAGAFPMGRLFLAGALVRVARLVPPDLTSATIPVTALYRGEPLDARLRRILDGPDSPAPVRTRAQRLMVAAAVVAGCVLAVPAMHELLESAVSYLP